MGSVSSCSRSRRAVDGRGASDTSDVFSDWPYPRQRDRRRDAVAALALHVFCVSLHTIGKFNHQLIDMIKTTPLSAAQYDWLAAAAKRTHRTVEATSAVIEAVERVEMEHEWVTLDELLK